MHLFWHRRDLRIPDNRGLALAARDDDVLPVFVVEEELLRQLGGRQRAFVLAGVDALRAAYRRRGGDLLVRRGKPAPTLAGLRDALDAGFVYYNRHYRPARRNRERRVQRRMPARAVTDLVLVDPERLDERYPNHGRFYDDWSAEPKPEPLDEPDADALVDPQEVAERILAAPATEEQMADPLAATGDDEADLTPGPAAAADDDAADLPEGVADIDLPTAGYGAARERYDQFLDAGIESYADTRDGMAAAVERPVGAVSRLSPYLAAGMVGIREVWADATARYERADEAVRRNVGKYRYELSWREHNYHLLSHTPTLLTNNYRDPPNPIAWRNDPDEFAAWKRGETGYPLVDAGMRQLEAEGYVHNRPRQNVASFLTKHLLVDWRKGARYFATKLVDHDPANNYGNWQWIASTGTDSVDVRIFDPVAQMDKYDPGADYVKAYVPELRDAAPERVVEWPTLSAGTRESLAPEYPDPVVDRDAAYERAKRVFETALGKR